MKANLFAIYCSIVLLGGVGGQGNSGNKGGGKEDPTPAPTATLGGSATPAPTAGPGNSGGGKPTAAPTSSGGVSPTAAPTEKPGGGKPDTPTSSPTDKPGGQGAGDDKKPAGGGGGDDEKPADGGDSSADFSNITDENNTEVDLGTSRTLLHVMGQSGKFTIYNSLLGKAQGLTVTMDALKELDSDGNAVGATGSLSLKHSLNTFATQSFDIKDPVPVKVDGVDASLVAFSSPINSIGKIQVDTYIMEGAGQVGPPGEKWAVSNGDLKWNIKLFDWTWCGCKSGAEVGAFVDLDVSVKGPKTANMKKGSNKSIDMGDGVSLELSDQVLVDGNWTSMPAGYPKITVKGSSTIFTFRFPKFVASATYDPLVSGMTPPTSAPTPAPGSSPTPETPMPTFPKGPGATPAPTVAGATPMPTVADAERDQVAGSFALKVADPQAFVNNEANKAPIARGIAKAVNVSAEDVKVTLSLDSRRLKGRSLADGQVKVEYIIFLSEDATSGGDVAAAAATIKSALQAPDITDTLAKLINEEAGAAFAVVVASKPSAEVVEAATPAPTAPPAANSRGFTVACPTILTWTFLSLMLAVSHGATSVSA
eukprot:TRINITY_DN14082_c0_g1_i2.p1 TRINITY_DN14082_c0_g1~~TRINITY_DN14082_c0_g1_i2.p1  ORF type:complete len:626 (+),score=118.28 TRINITY_DN14082_c0_g1_i2:99-1880(+)